MRMHTLSLPNRKPNEINVQRHRTLLKIKLVLVRAYINEIFTHAYTISMYSPFATTAAAITSSPYSEGMATDCFTGECNNSYNYSCGSSSNCCCFIVY